MRCGKAPVGNILVAYVMSDLLFKLAGVTAAPHKRTTRLVVTCVVASLVA